MSLVLEAINLRARIRPRDVAFADSKDAVHVAFKMQRPIWDVGRHAKIRVLTQKSSNESAVDLPTSRS